MQARSSKHNLELAFTHKNQIFIIVAIDKKNISMVFKCLETRLKINCPAQLFENLVTPLFLHLIS